MWCSQKNTFLFSVLFPLHVLPKLCCIRKRQVLHQAKGQSCFGREGRGWRKQEGNLGSTNAKLDLERARATVNCNFFSSLRVEGSLQEPLISWHHLACDRHFAPTIAKGNQQRNFSLHHFSPSKVKSRPTPPCLNFPRCLEAVSHSVAQDGLKLMAIFLP